MCFSTGPTREVEISLFSSSTLFSSSIPSEVLVSGGKGSVCDVEVVCVMWSSV